LPKNKKEMSAILWESFNPHNNTFEKYSNSDAIETSFQRGDTQYPFIFGANRYVIVFASMQQVNQDDISRRRHVKRTEALVVSSSAASAVASEAIQSSRQLQNDTSAAIQSLQQQQHDTSASVLRSGTRTVTRGGTQPSSSEQRTWLNNVRTRHNTHTHRNPSSFEGTQIPSSLRQAATEMTSLGAQGEVCLNVGTVTAATAPVGVSASASSSLQMDHFEPPSSTVMVDSSLSYIDKQRERIQTSTRTASNDAEVSNVPLSVSSDVASISDNTVNQALARLSRDPGNDEDRAALFKLFEKLSNHCLNLRGNFDTLIVQACTSLPSGPASAVRQEGNKLNDPQLNSIREDGTWFVRGMYITTSSVLRELMRISDAIAGLMRRIAEDSDKECPVCLEKYTHDHTGHQIHDGESEVIPRYLGCGHKICASCWDNWSALCGAAPTCPICRGHEQFSADIEQMSAEEEDE
jgi:WWE domain